MAQTNAGDSQKEGSSACKGKDISLDQFRWENRILVLFSPDSDDESYQTQMEKFSNLEDELRDRDLILFSVFDEECSKLNDEVISDTSAESIRERLGTQDNGYSIFLFGKDGGVKLNKDEVLEPEELFRVIDRMPMRRREMREGG